MLEFLQNYLDNIAETPKQYYDNLHQATINSRWEDTTQLYLVKEQKALPFKDEYEEYEMIKDEHGVFSITIVGDLQERYYTYFVTNAYNKQGKEIVDPYAKGCGVNGLRGMVVNFNKVDDKVSLNIFFRIFET